MIGAGACIGGPEYNGGENMAPGEHGTVVVCGGLISGGVGIVKNAGGIVDDEDGIVTERRCFLPRPLLDDAEVFPD